MREVIHGPHLHAAAAAGVIAEAVVTADLDPDPYLDLLGEDAESEMRGGQGVLATAGAPGDLSPHQQRKRSAAPRLVAVGAQ